MKGVFELVSELSAYTGSTGDPGDPGLGPARAARP
jgi:hypothetical protein